MTKLTYSTDCAPPRKSIRLIDVVAKATVAAQELAALGGTPSERAIVARIAEQAMREVFAEARQ